MKAQTTTPHTYGIFEGVLPSFDTATTQILITLATQHRASGRGTCYVHEFLKEGTLRSIVENYLLQYIKNDNLIEGVCDILIRSGELEEGLVELAYAVMDEVATEITEYLLGYELCN